MRDCAVRSNLSQAVHDSVGASRLLPIQMKLFNIQASGTHATHEVKNCGRQACYRGVGVGINITIFAVPGWVALLFRAFVFAALVLLFGFGLFLFLLASVCCLFSCLVGCFAGFCLVLLLVRFSFLAFFSCELAVPSSTCLRLLSHLYAFLTLYYLFISPY